MRQVVFILFTMFVIGCGGSKASSEEMNLLLATSKEGCTIISPCRLNTSPPSEITIETERYPDDGRQRAIPIKSFDVPPNSVIFREGQRIGCDSDSVWCDVTMMPDGDGHFLFLVDRQDASTRTLFRLEDDNTITVLKRE